MFSLVEGIKRFRELYNREPGASEGTEAFFRTQLGRCAGSPVNMKQERLTSRKSTFNVKHPTNHLSLPLSNCANFMARIRHQPVKMLARHENAPDAHGCNPALARLDQGQL